MKVCLHPLHFVVKNLLEQHFKINGGGTNLNISKILQSKSSLAINASLWKNRTKKQVVLVIAHGIFILVNKDKKDKVVDPFNIKLVQSIVLSHNVAGVAAFHLTDAGQVMQGFSHLIIESQSLGLLLRYILNGY